MHAQSRPTNFYDPNAKEIVQVGINVQLCKRLMLVWLHGVNRCAIMHWKTVDCDFIKVGSIIEIAVKPIELREETFWAPYEVTKCIKVLETVKNEVKIQDYTCFALYEVDFANRNPMFDDYSAISGNYILDSEIGNVLLERTAKSDEGIHASKKIIEDHNGKNGPSKVVGWFKYVRCLVPAAMIQQGCDVREEVYSYVWRMEEVLGTMAAYKAKQSRILSETIPAEKLPDWTKEDDVARQKRQARLEFEANQTKAQAGPPSAVSGSTFSDSVFPHETTRQPAPAPVYNLPPGAPVLPNFGYDVYGTARPSTEGLFHRARQTAQEQAEFAQQAAREAEQQAELRARQQAEQQAQLRAQQQADRAQQAAREAEHHAQQRAQQAAREAELQAQQRAQQQAQHANHSAFSAYGAAGPVGNGPYSAPSLGNGQYAPSVASSRGTDQYGPSAAPPAPQSNSGAFGFGYAGQPAAPSHMPPHRQITIEELAKKLDDLTAYVYRQDREKEALHSEKEALHQTNCHLRNGLAKIIFAAESMIDIPKVKAQMKIQDIDTFNVLEDAIAEVKAASSDQQFRPRGY
ncbi:hypothetical protein GCK72_026166 [Caenorhabditis remanei]|uniref:Uncharacterized protein n=1 Tax=Caenorhabditis remanei TaxID=31234 RepID=A0A6A5G3X3_CAERE|nr:hypothetical protein GCK72_026166 [Caenorhabditis remanei]KAF1749698.1 hypothetical protein GCK72_026166 [Caenorhabditis remanei]